MRPVRSLLFVIPSLVTAAGVARADDLHDLARRYISANTAREAAAHAAIPSFSRQTGFACNVCHTTFPQLTQFGRLFKLNGYTLTGLQTINTGEEGRRQALSINLIPPVSAMVQASFTSTSKVQPGTQNGNLELPQELSLFLGEEITPRLGTFLQFTYEGASGAIGIDNVDVRFADQASTGALSLIYGVTLNNNPTVQDVWNTVPAWGFPFASSGVAPTPAASTLIDGGLGQQVAGLGAYALWNSLLYTEVSLYRSAPQGGAHPPDATSENTLHGVAPYWRLAIQHPWGNHYLSAGTYGMHTSLYPSGVTGPTDSRTDVAFDAQYEQTMGKNQITGHATWIHEQQNLDASVAAGAATNASNTLSTLRVDGSFYTGNRLGVTLGAFSTSGSQDALLYAPGPVSGSQSGSPNSNGFIAQLDFLPWLNTRLELQYVMYSKFNGGGSNYDGSGRNASDNNTLYVLTWLVF
jgi:hypothetical protein